MLYLGPNTCVPVRSPSADLSPVLSAFERKTFDGLGNVAQIHIIVDAIMFEKGEMLTLKNSAYADEIVARVGAANEIAAFVQAGLAGGERRIEVLTRLSEAVQTRSGNEGVWLRDFAAFLSRLPDKTFSTYLTSLGHLKPPTILVSQK